MAARIYAHARGSVSPLTWNKAGSFFWRDIRSIMNFFQFSTRIDLQAGSNTSFWFDNWGGTPLCWLTKGMDLPPRQRISFSLGWASRYELIQFPPDLHMASLLSSVHTHASPSSQSQLDSIRWYWTSNGDYSAASFYKAITTAGKHACPLMLWKLRVPPSLKLFLVLLSHDRLLTRQQLARRHILNQLGCVLCNQECLEDSMHLFFNCNYFADVWAQLRINVSVPLSSTSFCSVQDAVFSSFRALRNRINLSTVLATAWWAIWLERNNRIFRGKSRDASSLAGWILSESMAYLSLCY